MLTPIRGRERVAEELAEPVLHGERRVQGPFGMILLGRGCPERRHDCVAGELLDLPSGRLDLRRHRGVEALEQRAHAFGILLARQRRRPDEVGEEGPSRSCARRSAGWAPTCADCDAARYWFFWSLASAVTAVWWFSPASPIPISFPWNSTTAVSRKNVLGVRDRLLRPYDEERAEGAATRTGARG